MGVYGGAVMMFIACSLQGFYRLYMPCSDLSMLSTYGYLLSIDWIELAD